MEWGLVVMNFLRGGMGLLMSMRTADFVPWLRCEGFGPKAEEMLRPSEKGAACPTQILRLARTSCVAQTSPRRGRLGTRRGQVGPGACLALAPKWQASPLRERLSACHSVSFTPCDHYPGLTSGVPPRPSLPPPLPSGGPPPPRPESASPPAASWLTSVPA
jgi:hypothetical protein